MCANTSVAPAVKSEPEDVQDPKPNQAVKRDSADVEVEVEDEEV